MGSKICFCKILIDIDMVSSALFSGRWILLMKYMPGMSILVWRTLSVNWQKMESTVCKLSPFIQSILLISVTLNIYVKVHSCEIRDQVYTCNSEQDMLASTSFSKAPTETYPSTWIRKKKRDEEEKMKERRDNPEHTQIMLIDYLR